MTTTRKKKPEHMQVLHDQMDNLVWELFIDCIHHGVIVISREEMRNILINWTAEFIEFQRSKNDKNA